MSKEPDPQLAEQLARLTALLPPVDYASASGEEIARLLRGRAPVIQFPAPDGLAIEDHEIPVTGGTITVRRYRPLVEAHGGAVLSFHGGGWVLGNLDSDEMRCRTIASASGCQVFAVDYRLAPEHPFPVPAEDCLSALEWVVARADGFGIDPSRIGVSGSSAGGNLAAAVALMARDRGGPAIAFQLLVYPACDPDPNRSSWIDHGRRFPLTAEDMQWFWNQYAPGETAFHPYAAVIHAKDLTRLPPAHVAVAQCDLLRDEGIAYADRLRDSGVPVTVSEHEGMVHGFLAVAPDHPASQAAISTFGAILRSALEPGKD